MASQEKVRGKQYRMTPIASAVALTILGASLSAHAQEASTTAKTTQEQKASENKELKLETVVVTANRRIEKLGDVPMSITVVGEEDLKRNEVREFVDLINIAPALSISIGTQVGTNSINMRGIGTTSNNLGIEGDISVIVDDLPYAQPQQAFKDLSDAARIEVLKGPQSTMFGKSAIAGAIVVTTKPIGSGPMKANIRTFRTSDQEYRISSSISGRLTDDVGLRIFASKTNFPGSLTNLYDNSKTNGSGGKTFLAKLEWKISNDLSFLVSPYFDHTITTGNSVAVTSITPGDGNFLNKAYSAMSIAEVLKGITIGPYNRSTRIDAPTGLDATNRGVGMRFNYFFPDNSPLSGHSLASITSFNNYQSNDYRDNDSIDINSALYLPLISGKPAGVTLSPRINGHADTKTSTQEFRLTSPDIGSFRYLVGLWAARNTLDRDYLRGDPTIKATNYTNYVTTSGNLNHAIYSNASWEVAPKHTLTAGLRLNREISDYTFHTLDSLTSSGTSWVHTGELFYRAPQHTENATTGKLGYSYNIEPETMVYATVSTGNKGVAYDMTSGANNPKVFARLPLKAEKAESFEAGLKANLWNNRATLNAAIYRTKFTDYQTSSTERFSDGTSASILYSVPALLTRGFEVDGKVLLSRELLMNASIAYTKATILEWGQAPCFSGATDCTVPNVLVPGAFVRDAAGGSMPNAPKWKISMGGEYTMPLNVIPYKAAMNFQWRAQGNVKGNISQDPKRDRPGYGLFDLGLTFNSKSGGHKIGFGIKNVFDKHYAAGNNGGFLTFLPQSGSSITTTGWTPARDAFRYFTVRFDMEF